ncbi:MAG: Cd(II)/Pb(II)-responsive transcriptional regulator [Burkholderiaceae bacterium]|nr:Cd(II)/Pb(II)-responsive transcriptional regulator [Burkholderiaceae bacterium]
MKIGELAKLAGCDVVTVRFYEGAGLLPAPARSGNNYRLYGLPHLETLHFIRQCRLLDIPLLDIGRLLQLRGSPQESCADVNGLLDAQIDRVKTRIEQLKLLEVEMNNLRRQCGSGIVRQDCAILAELSNPGDGPWQDKLLA